MPCPKQNTQILSQYLCKYLQYNAIFATDLTFLKIHMLAYPKEEKLTTVYTLKISLKNQLYLLYTAVPYPHTLQCKKLQTVAVLWMFLLVSSSIQRLLYFNPISV